MVEQQFRDHLVRVRVRMMARARARIRVLAGRPPG